MSIRPLLDVMKPGSVLVDLAAANGGNVAQTVANEVITTDNGVTIIGYTDLPSRLASTSSTLVSVLCCLEVEDVFTSYVQKKRLTYTLVSNTHYSLVTM